MCYALWPLKQNLNIYQLLGGKDYFLDAVLTQSKVNEELDSSIWYTQVQDLFLRSQNRLIYLSKAFD